jgi:hypothetical protein
MATLVLLTGLVGGWFASARIARHDLGVEIGAGVCLAVTLAWFALGHWETLALRLIPWDDFVYFQELPLYLAVLWLLMLCLRRLSGFVRAMTALLVVVFALWSLAGVTGPLWLSVYLPRLQGTPATAFDTQSTGWSCAPAALAQALRRKGLATSERQVAVLAATSPLGGTSDRGLLRAAHRRGIPGATLLRPAFWPDLRTAPKPVLAEWYLGQGVAHMITITAVESDRVQVLDPLTGEQTYTRAEFERY